MRRPELFQEARQRVVVEAVMLHSRASHQLRYMSELKGCKAMFPMMQHMQQR